VNAHRDAEGTFGLYRADDEHDACGTGFVAHARGRRSHEVLRAALTMLENLAHRGGVGVDPDTGDGAGVLLQVPHALYRDTVDFALPREGAYGVGMLFLPRDAPLRARCEAALADCAAQSGLTVLGWRDVPTDPTCVGPTGRASMPDIVQVFVAGRAAANGQSGVFAADGALDGDALERQLYALRRRWERAVAGVDAYACSLSSRTVVYKGLLLPSRLAGFYRDLADDRAVTALALVHQRFSTNTLPAWRRAHPYRMVAHNGEINALRGNRSAMRGREATLDAGDLLPREILTPVLDPQGSDSAMLDNALELLVRAGRALPHAARMLVPEAWENDTTMPARRRDLYAWMAERMEPWDGPAAVCFTDGVAVGAMLDRNGLRPLRWLRTHDGRVVACSEAGALPLDPSAVAQRGRIGPGGMILVDTVEGTVRDGASALDPIAASRPWGRWLRGVHVTLSREDAPAKTPAREDLPRAQRAFGYSREDLKLVLPPMARGGEEAVGSMGNDAPPAALSRRPQPLFHHFRQLFAQVTNPPMDPIREAPVMSLRTVLGPAPALLRDDAPAFDARRVLLDDPILSPRDLERLCDRARTGLVAETLDATFVDDLDAALTQLADRAEALVREGVAVIVVSDQGATPERAPVPSLLALAAVQERLVRAGLRGAAGLVVDSGDAREVMHACLLLGYGADALHPRVACASVVALARDGELDGVTDPADALHGYLSALRKGVLKVMSKMGIATVASYRGAQVFEALGLHPSVVSRFFSGTHSSIGGADLAVIAAEALSRHAQAYPAQRRLPALDVGGHYQWRVEGESHLWNPDALGQLQHAVKSARYELFERFAARADDDARRHGALRAMFDFVPAMPIPLDEVEPEHEIVKRFKTGAMSFGSISAEAHETLAVAMNRLGARSNSGEGGEDPARFVPDARGDLRRSAIKQVASGRFGVTSHYLVNADELQIKMAQGAKPGEGGQLPGHKVDAVIARVRNSTEGVGLISPPPHHDIYSIEDLAQLIHDLRCANDRARVSVKLVAEHGVGTVAAGVAKAGADVILVSGDGGGTGAAPLGSIKHAGIPWEIGLAEAQQALVHNGLRGRVRLETDGQLRTARDIAVAAMLGAEEFGFATAALVATGCVLMRVCHLNTCPVGIATQDPRLRARFAGEPEHVVNLMVFLARSLRELMASLGFRRVDEMVGRADRLRFAVPEDHWKAQGIDLRPLLAMGPEGASVRGDGAQPALTPSSLERAMARVCAPAITAGTAVRATFSIANTDRTTGARVSAEVSRALGAQGLARGTVSLSFRGSAGPSFGAFLAPGVSLALEGEANDHVAKGLSGGEVSVRPFAGALGGDALLGNVALYGATAGWLFAAGAAGERFAVRNSGATAVVEGVGDHGCEYMTGGAVLVLGEVGKNFGAGMSGGVAWVLDARGDFAQRVAKGVTVDVPEPTDLARIEALLRDHVARTGSPVAVGLLAQGVASLPWCLVLPKEFRAALARRLPVVAEVA
jgi:glutamate synthase domain-containing protein 2/glutamate synthase domain-containing protein 1/glutamate synthase domain-containing protein 3